MSNYKIAHSLDQILATVGMYTKIPPQIKYMFYKDV